MLRERDPFGRALVRLRSDLRSGAFAPGQALTIVELARDLNLSPTPVREALSRLAGEGLVEDRRGRGYFSWRMDTLDLIELFDLDALHVGAALQTLRQGAGVTGGASLRAKVEALEEGLEPYEAVAVLAEALVARVMDLGGGRALGLCQAKLLDRLGPVRRTEPRVLSDLRLDWLEMIELADQERWSELSLRYDRYHERRRGVATPIVAALRRRHGVPI